MRYWVLAALVASSAGCSRDWDGFSVSDDTQADSSTGGTDAGSGGSGMGGSGGQPCGTDQKRCGTGSCVTTDPEHGCGESSCEPCALPNAKAACDTAGSCAIEICDSGFSDCDGVAANGCETDLLNDPTRCGACDKNCTGANSTPTCTQGKCVVACSKGFADCDTQETNGCEVDLQSDSMNCGACNKPCPGQTICQGGTCVSNCTAPYTLCGGGCVVLEDSPAHCGKCDNACPSPAGGTGVCVKGNCNFVCSVDLTKCGSECTNLSSDPHNCGKCGTTCSVPANGTAVCVDDICGISCKTGFTKCGTDCRNILTDPRNCGSCGDDCPTPIGGSALCNNGVCGVSCIAPYTACGNACRNLKSDPENCGKCGIVCARNASCVSGKCLGIATP
ncbi:MAG: hypothetical protein R3B13_16195 [Polyangiaceae bacterium]